MEGHIVLPPLGQTEWTLLWAVLASAFVAMGYGWYLVRRVLAEDPGTKKMQEIARAIEEGAMAYLGRQVRTMIWFVVLMAAGLFLMYYSVPEQYPHPLPIGVAVAFLMGVMASYGAGYVGMWLAVKANLRTANAALKGFKPALELAFRAGTVSGMFTVGFGLLGAVLIFMIFQENAMKVLIGFGFGGSLAALFMRVGGGIFTKAADVGADLVGKIEQNIPEDDPRNPAVIADNVGDNVGDCAGMAADIFESYEVTLVAAIILAAVCTVSLDFTAIYGEHASTFALKLILYPLLIRAVGVFSSIIGTWAVRGKEEELADPMRPITVGYWTASLVSVVGFLIVNYFYLLDPFTGAPDFRFFWATTMGIVLAIVTLWLTNHFTHPDLRPTTETAIAARTGAATLLLAGMAEGFESTVWAAVAIGLTILSSLVIFPDSPALAAYGIALTGLGLLTTTGFILAMDTYGPITDNAHGIFEMSGITEEHEASRNLAWMDAIGNTTKALTKGLAIATAVIAAISLFRSFIDATGLMEKGIQVNLPEVFVGLLIGGAVPFLFSSFAIKAVGRAAYLVVQEVRRQFREHPGIMTYDEKPEYGTCVSIVTAAAQKELLGPAILAIATPILIGFGLGPGALGGYLAGAILTGQLLAGYMCNTGATWDNAKKKIEDGFLGGKGTPAHVASVIGDTVGDPYKDTAGPAFNPLIKVMNLVGLLVAPFIIDVHLHEASVGRILIVVLCLIVLGIGIVFSKRGSLAEMAEEEEKSQVAQG
ncbi:MAG: sodium-translocating pyrophosphatase [bacterium]|nr:sodium-translocating pyrophosphatase [bacterium]